MRRLLPLVLLLSACGDDASPVGNLVDTADTPADTEGDVSVMEDVLPDTGPDAGPTDPQAALEATVAALCPDYAAAWCQADCGCDAAPGFPEDCEAAFVASCEARLEGYLPLVESGQAEFVPGGARDCLDNFAPLAAACVPFSNDLFFFVCPILAPPGGFPPLPGAGESCEGACASGLRCGTTGTCITPGDIDAPCTTALDCATTLVCVEDTETSSGRCAAPRHADIGAPCAGNDDCSGDTGCLASARKVCEQPASGPCAQDEDCPANEWCDAALDDGRCVPDGAAGEACGNGIVCQAGLACGADSGLCGAVPVKGEPCALGRFGPFLCAEGLVCLDSLTCGDAPIEGQPCGLGSPACAAGLGCAFEAEGSFCRQKADAGARCENDDTCRDDLFCDFGTNTCTPFLARGEVCTDGNECGPTGACLPGPGFVFQCADKPGLGGECFLDECDDGLICRTPYEAGVCAPVLCTMMRF